MPSIPNDPATARGDVLAWLHIGDLHLTTPADAETLRDLDCIIALANGLAPGSLDFAVLPGDNADDGTAEQYALLHEAVAGLRLPLHVLPGDHDFRLGEAQLAWAERELEAAEAVAEGAVVFIHTYPADLREGAERLGALLARPQVLCVDMGHTHYNKLANDGGTIFMATCSTGQVEEGPSGFSIAAVDGCTVSWRFKPLDEAWPFVLITRPADRRLVTDVNQIVDGRFLARAKVVGDAPVASVEVQVRAWDARGRQDEDRVEPAGPSWTAPERAADGSDQDRVGAWPEKGILNTRLGPNRNGKQW